MTPSSKIVQPDIASAIKYSAIRFSAIVYDSSMLGTKIFSAPLLRLILLLFLTGCGYGYSPVQFAGQTMGTTYSVVLIPESQGGRQVNPAALQAEVDRELGRINKLMSTYDASSQLSQLNAHPVGKFFVVDPDLYAVLQASQELARLSNGAMDVTVGSLVNLWGFGPDYADNKPPSDSEISLVRENMGYQALDIDIEHYRVRRTKAFHIDLSSIAKGFAVDQIRDLLRRRGHDDFLVEIGGELFASGRINSARQWQVAIEAPVVDSRSIQTTLPLQDMAMATSGDYRNYFDWQGKRYSHTIDPRSGYPVEHQLVSVTVIAASAMDADGWATAISVLGLKQGMQLANAQQLAVLAIIETDSGLETIRSEKLAAYAGY